MITATPSSPGATTPARAALARRAREVFRRTRLDWLAGATGEALYDRADAYAREYGCALVREIPATASRIFLTPCTASTSWRTPTSRPPTASVLEIQVRDLTLPVGAFYEDVLLREA